MSGWGEGGAGRGGGVTAVIFSPCHQVWWRRLPRLTAVVTVAQLIIVPEKGESRKHRPGNLLQSLGSSHRRPAEPPLLGVVVIFVQAPTGM